MGEGTRQQILAALSTEERLARLDPEVIEEYLRQQQVKDESAHAAPVKTVRRKTKKKGVSAK